MSADTRREEEKTKRVLVQLAACFAASIGPSSNGIGFGVASIGSTCLYLIYVF